MLETMLERGEQLNKWRFVLTKQIYQTQLIKRYNCHLNVQYFFVM